MERDLGKVLRISFWWFVECAAKMCSIGSDFCGLFTAFHGHMKNAWNNSRVREAWSQNGIYIMNILIRLKLLRHCHVPNGWPSGTILQQRVRDLKWVKWPYDMDLSFRFLSQVSTLGTALRSTPFKTQLNFVNCVYKNQGIFTSNYANYNVLTSVESQFNSCSFFHPSP